MKKDEQKEEDFSIVAKAMAKKFGKGFCLFQLKENKRVLNVETTSTGLPSLDNAIGVGGLPKGRVIEIYGPESGGKTTLSLACAASAQKEGGKVLIIDMEHALQPTWMAAQGIKDDIWVVQPDNAEQALEVALAGIQSGMLSMVVIDSIAALVPEAEVNGEMTDQQMGLVARILGKFFRKAVGPLKKTGCTLVCINQTRMMLGPMARETRPGGNALKFAASIVMRVKKKGEIQSSGELAGVWIEVTIRKNKVAPPFEVCKIPLLFDRGFCGEMDLIEAAVENGIVDKSGAWYSYNGERIGQGILNTTNYVLDNRDIFNSIRDAYIKETRKDVVVVDIEDNLELDTKDADV